MNIITLSKPWTEDSVWFDLDKKEVVVKTTDGVIRKWDTFAEVSLTTNDGNPKVKIEEGGSICTFEISYKFTNDFIDALKEGFEKISKIKNPFLCPNCKYGCLMRTVKSLEGIPYTTEYMCIDTSKRRQQSQLSTIPKGNIFNPLDYENGPGGWDGKTCPNYIEATYHKEPVHMSSSGPDGIKQWVDYNTVKDQF